MKLFPTDKKESLAQRMTKLAFNLAPVIRGSGSWIRFLSDDWHEMHVSLPLSLRTRNYVGTLFGGAMFSASDPWYMIMLFQILGKDYIIWDKSANIRFFRPGKSKLKGHFLISEEDIKEIREEVRQSGEMEKVFTLDWVDKNGKVVSRVEKLVYIANKTFYKDKRKNKALQK